MPRYTISKKFTFSASHQLSGLADDHPCARLHGHNYTVELVLARNTLDAVGFVYDYRALDRFKVWLDGTFDHRHLNDVMGSNPTAECIGIRIAREAESILRLPFTETLSPGQASIVAVRVYETDKTCAEVRP